jgi:hypothetical protein
LVETVLTALAPIVVTLLVGFVAAWHQDFGAKDAAVLNRMVLLYAVPVALFVGTAGTARGELAQEVAFAVAMCVAQAWIEAGIEPKSLELAQYAVRPLMLAVVVALAIAFFMRETYPRNVAR